MFSLVTAATLWSANSFRILAFALAAHLHPGAESFAAPFVEAAAAAVESDPNPVGGADAELADILVWAKHESDFGRALSGKRYDSQAYGILQVRGSASLEHDPVASVREWLVRLHAAARLCGDARALAGLSSGRCDRGVRLAEQRELEAAVALATVQGSP